MRLIHVALVTLILIYTQLLYAAEEMQLQVDIQGLTYQAVISENSNLASKISGIDEELSGKHYVGVLQNENNSWVRVSLVDGQWQGIVAVNNAMHIIQHQVVPIGAAAATTNEVMNSKPVAEMDGLQGTCGRGDGTDTMLDHVAQLSATSGMTSASSPSPLSATFAQFCSQEVNGICVIAEIEIAFDLEFQAVFGGQATAQAMSILNIVDGHYMNDLKISIDAITVEMLTDDLFSTSVAASPVLDAGVLLDDIEMKKNNALIPFITNNNALTHVVTGRDFNGGTLGVAYLGSVCEANGFSTGTSSIFFDNLATPNIALTAVVVAHELAHNLGSDHDGPGANVLCPSSTFIMSPIINPAFNLTNFSSCSAEDIEATISALVTPELCMDFPVDVSIIENSGNGGILNANLDFTSSFTATTLNGFKAVDRINLTGSINPAEGVLMSVIANGVNCTVAAGGGSYSCIIANPPISFPVIANMRVNAAASSITLTQNINEDTADVQEVNSFNNILVSTCSIAGNNAICSTSPPPSIPNTPTNNTNNIAEEGGGGSQGILFTLFMLGVYVCSRARN
ncbi:MAG: M12 family metallo-peptidase [Gammaproteobacteria bacterium]|nr:M12 family metallo-peptidase [Gammaproteobacteria bacterium]